MNCPACHSALERTQYEGFPVFRCTGCQGYLVANRRFEDIQRQRIKQPKELIAEAAVAAGSETSATLRCPRCNQKMDKHPLRQSHEFCIDECAACEASWFDAGELAIVQLEHDAKPGPTSANQLKNRVREMSPEEIAEFERNLAKLPVGDADSFLAGIRDGILESLRNQGLWRIWR